MQQLSALIYPKVRAAFFTRYWRLLMLLHWWSPGSHCAILSTAIHQIRIKVTPHYTHHTAAVPAKVAQRLSFKYIPHLHRDDKSVINILCTLRNGGMGNVGQFFWVSFFFLIKCSAWISFYLLVEYFLALSYCAGFFFFICKRFVGFIFGICKPALPYFIKTFKFKNGPKPPQIFDGLTDNTQGW